eukprot:6470044-Alexandrium_andersonii.AAC.1
MTDRPPDRDRHKCNQRQACGGAVKSETSTHGPRDTSTNTQRHIEAEICRHAEAKGRTGTNAERH